ncbi:LuxR C-terminal-related transcriptional regulator [Streptomyces sp. NBC_00178]|uniref:LuxR C-terminal-related transcriptional regulator n=1 Tax=Streptomyces sp. NBC_00178 TaxID=2975672 RepID=UPI002E2CE59E|nr:LuxR C-terminal-related transcriptional regulator [Streptomyces sp. NBC_00178]
MGKSRLIREAVGHPVLGPGRGAGVTLLAGACPPLREPFPYGPVFDVLRTLEGAVPAGLNPVCGALRPYMPELAGRLPPAPDPLADPAAAAHRLFRAVRALLAATAPVVLVVEDLHWADDGTRDLLRFLVDDPPPGLSTVLSYRREDLPGGSLPLGRAYRHPPGVTSVLIPLVPLDVTGVRTLAAALTGGDVPTAVAERLHGRTAGIPFVLEFVLEDPAELDGSGGAVPALLQEAMTERLAGLSAPAAASVHAAAVLRVPATEELIGAVAGQKGDAAADALREALLAGVLHDIGDDRYGFRHGLAQQAVYEGLLRLDRRRLHRRVVTVLAAQDNPPLVQLSYHAKESGDLDIWRGYAEQAAQSARELGDTALAVELYEQLLDDPGLPEADRARMAVRLSRAALVGLAYRRSSRLLRRIVSSAPSVDLPDAVRGEIRLNLGLLLNNQAGRHEQGRLDTEAAVDELHDQPELAARGMAGLAMPVWGEHHESVYVRWAERAEELAARHGDRALRIAVRGNHLALRVGLGRGDEACAEALALLGEPAERAEQVQLARMCANLTDVCAWVGRDADAGRFSAEGMRLAEAAGAPFMRGIIEGTALRMAWTRGRWQGLAEAARGVLADAPGLSGIESDAHLVVGLLAETRGEWGQALGHLEAAALGDPSNAPAPALAVASAAAVRVLLERGEVPEACAEADRALGRVRRKGVWGWAAELVPAAVAAYARAGRAVAAGELVAEFEAGLGDRDAPAARAALAACRGAHAEAAVLFAALPAPYPAALCAEAAASDVEQLAAVAARFEALGATRDAARCRSALRGSGVARTGGSPRGRRGYGNELSPRERDVARLVATGHTNRQIAELLFLSPRTVEQHVAKVLRKLDVATRAEVERAGPV